MTKSSSTRTHRGDEMPLIQPEQIVDVARECLGANFRHQGRSPITGLDCIGVVLYDARRLNITQYEPPAYQRHAKWHEFLKLFAENLDAVKGPPQIGDILCFRQEKYPCHCGILTGERFIHAYALRRKVVEELYSPRWRLLTRAVFRYPGVAVVE